MAFIKPDGTARPGHEVFNELWTYYRSNQCSLMAHISGSGIRQNSMCSGNQSRSNSSPKGGTGKGIWIR